MKFLPMPDQAEFEAGVIEAVSRYRPAKLLHAIGRFGGQDLILPVAGRLAVKER